eukprot:jgi/Tetstr1/440677/TSEL_028986.t1
MPPVTKEEKAAKNRRYYEKNKEKIRKRQADHYLKRKSKKAAASTDLDFSVVVACSDRAFRKDEPVPKIFATRLEAPSLDPAS